MRNLRAYLNINGYHWLGFERHGEVFFVRCLGRVGDCVNLMGA